jgi:hypothetical protein
MDLLAPIRTGTSSGHKSWESQENGRTQGSRDADSMAIASFVMGLVGLLVFNVFLGPSAIVLGGMALTHGTARRTRAALGLALGVADLAVLAVLVTVDHTVSWQLAG